VIFSGVNSIISFSGSSFTGRFADASALSFFLISAFSFALLAFSILFSSSCSACFLACSSRSILSLASRSASSFIFASRLTLACLAAFSFSSISFLCLLILDSISRLNSLLLLIQDLILSSHIDYLSLFLPSQDHHQVQTESLIGFAYFCLTL